ncbi:hypothetical protein BSKO_05203 [Bryopsis sp. KO-2023]|nr:hypothetical protein BSKO_05203 [Bryopsis sp. KO-2023]
MFPPGPRGPGAPGFPGAPQQGGAGNPQGGPPGQQFQPPSMNNPPGSTWAPRPQGPPMGGGFSSGQGPPPPMAPASGGGPGAGMGFSGPPGPPVGAMQRMSVNTGQHGSPKTSQPHPFQGAPNVRPGGPPMGSGFPGANPPFGSRASPASGFAPPPGGGGFPGSGPPLTGGPGSAGPFARPRPQGPPSGGRFPGSAPFPGARPQGPPSGPVGSMPRPMVAGRPMMSGPPSAPGPTNTFAGHMGPRHPGPPGPPGQPGFNPPQTHPPRPQFGAGMERASSPSSKIDPNQIPRPSLEVPSEPTIFQTRVKGQHQVPPQACAKAIVKDVGNASPKYMRLSLNNVPATSELVNQVTVPLVVFVQPLALPSPEEEPIQVVDFGEEGPIRCNRCRAYINPFMKFNDGGRTFQCSLCGVKNETPADYFCYLGPDGRRRDADERAELSKGTVEFVAPPSFCVRPPMPQTHFFLIDVSYQAVESGALLSTCNTIKQTLDSIQGGDRALAGIATFDGAIHFYSLKSPDASPQMLVVSDVSEAFAPVQNSLLVPVREFKDGLVGILELIVQMFASQKNAECCAGVAIEAAIEVLKSTGGKLHCILSSRPSKGARSLPQRDSTAIGAEKAEKEKQTTLIPQDNSYRSLATRAADYQVAVDLFILSQSYVDIATLGTLSSVTGGSVYRYSPFRPQYDEEQFFNDLRWNLTRPQGLEAVMRLRCSEGLEVESYLGACYLRTASDVDLPAIDCDKSVMIKLRHDDKLQEGSEACVQCALLYTTTSGQRRIRVNTVAVSVTGNISQIYRGADLESYLNYIARKMSISLPGNTLHGTKEGITVGCVNVLHAYRKYCATPMTSTGQLILPDALKLLPLYTLALLKTKALRPDVKPDERAAFLSLLFSLPCSSVLPLLYGRLIDLNSLRERKEGGVPQALAMSAEKLQEGHMYLLENGNEMIVKVESHVEPNALQELFGFDRVNVKAPEPQLLRMDNPYNKSVQNLINEMRKERSSYMRMAVALRSQPNETKFLNMLVEDRSSAGMSYVEYLCHVHRCIQGKMG